MYVDRLSQRLNNRENKTKRHELTIKEDLSLSYHGLVKLRNGTVDTTLHLIGNKIDTNTTDNLAILEARQSWEDLEGVSNNLLGR